MANRKNRLESQVKNVAQHKRVGKTSGIKLSIRDQRRKPRRAPRREEGQWVAMDDKRRRSIAFEKLAKRMLKYPENSDDVKVVVTELQEQMEISEELGMPSKQ